KEHNVDVSQIAGTGVGGRVTKNDILGFIEKGGPAAARVEPAEVRQPAAPAVSHTPVPSLPGDRIEPMSVMRRKIAEHMVVSKRTSAHVYSVFEVNYSAVDKIQIGRAHV